MPRSCNNKSKRSKTRSKPKRSKSSKSKCVKYVRRSTKKCGNGEVAVKGRMTKRGKRSPPHCRTSPKRLECGENETKVKGHKVPGHYVKAYYVKCYCRKKQDAEEAVEAIEENGGTAEIQKTEVKEGQFF